jgi:Fe-S-cluster containining protein
VHEGSFIFPSKVKFSCNKCGLCCGDTQKKTRHILLLDSEANEISKQTKQQIENFAIKTSTSPPYTYEMKKTLQGRCLFLQENNQCLIYQHRPLICRFYPFELKFASDEGKYVFEFTDECPEIGKGKKISKKDFENLFMLAKEKLH